MEKIAALFVATNGSYFGLPNVELWDEARDARTYAGPWPVVAHPPCQRWSKLWAGQPLHIKRTGERKAKGDDGGCFAAALDAVRKYGGVLEHPEHSHAWAYFGLNKPPREGGWISADFHGGWTCCVEQRGYGHYARKPTWLYAAKVTLPELLWGKTERRLDPAVVKRMGLKRAIRLGEVGGPRRRQRQRAAHRHAGTVPRSSYLNRRNRAGSPGGVNIGEKREITMPKKEVLYGRSPQGQLFYDLAFTDLSEPWLARKHKMPRSEVNRLRLLARTTLIGRRKLSKAARDRAVGSAVELNRVLDR